MNNTQFGSRISELRRQRGWSQKELGDILGVSNKAVSKWENGEAMPKTSTMIKLAELFEIDANELIGLKNNELEEEKSAQLAKQLDELKSENAVLSTKLEEITKKKKRILILSAIVCLIGIIATGIIAFSITSKDDVNSSITDAGDLKTKIEFCDMTFVPVEGFDGIMQQSNAVDISCENLDEEKYAQYYDSNGKNYKVRIKTDGASAYIVLPVGNKLHFYFNEKQADKLITVDNIRTVTYEKWGNDYYDDLEQRFYNKEFGSSDKFAIEKFCDFYNNKGKPVSKKITSRYLGKNSKSCWIDFDYSVSPNYFEIELGRFFKDEKGNIYFLDYATNESYKVTKELSKYVF